MPSDRGPRQRGFLLSKSMPVHCKKGQRFSRAQPARRSLGSDIQTGDRKITYLFLQCKRCMQLNGRILCLTYFIKECTFLCCTLEYLVQTAKYVHSKWWIGYILVRFRLIIRCRLTPGSRIRDPKQVYTDPGFLILDPGDPVTQTQAHIFDSFDNFLGIKYYDLCESAQIFFFTCSKI